MDELKGPCQLVWQGLFILLIQEPPGMLRYKSKGNVPNDSIAH